MAEQTEYKIYKSTIDEPFTVYRSDTPLAATAYPLIKEAPDMTVLHNPIYDWKTLQWVDQDTTQAAAQQNLKIQEALNSIKDLQEQEQSNAGLAANVKDLSDAQDSADQKQTVILEQLKNITTILAQLATPAEQGETE